MEYPKTEQGVDTGCQQLSGNHQGTGPPYRRRTLRGPDRFCDRGEAITPQQGGEPGFDLSDEIGAGEDEGRIELHEAGARTYLCVGILRTRDPADPDQRQAPLGQPVHFGE